MTPKTHFETGLLATIVTRPAERLSLFSMAIRSSRPWNPHEEALRLVYTEALLSGAGSLDRKAFLDTLSTHGITLSASQSGGIFRISFSAIDNTTAVAIKLFESVILAPHFTPNELKRIKEYVKNALILSKENARARAYAQFNNTLVEHICPDYIHESDALIQELASITVKEIQKLHQSLSQATWNVVIGAHEVVADTILSALRKIRKKSRFEEEGTSPYWDTKSVTGRQVHLIDIPAKHNIEFSIGSTLPLSCNAAAFPAFVFGMSVLALYGGFTGRLMSTVREKEGLTYSIYGQAERSTMDQTGFWRIMTFFNPKDAVAGVTATIREIGAMHQRGITDDELKRFRSILHTRNAMIEDSIQKKVREVGAYTLLGYTTETYAQYKKQLLNATKSEINDAMELYLNPQNLVISGAGPVTSVQKEFKQFM